MSERTRNPARIDPVIDKLRDVWKANPDMRLTQLVWWLARPEETAPRFFYTEDNELDWSDVPCTPPEWDGGYRLEAS